MGNEFAPSEIKKLIKYDKLECISIGDNKINSFDDLKPLCAIESIVQLDLSGTKFSESKDYKEKVFQNFPNLMILDNKDEQGKSYEFDSEEDENDIYDEDEEDQSYQDVEDESENYKNGKGKKEQEEEEYEEEDEEEEYSENSEENDFEDDQQENDEEEDEDDD